MNIITIRENYKYGLEHVNVLGGSFRNFGGEKRDMNEAGKRNFCITIDPELIPTFENWGVNVKYFKRSEEDDPLAIPPAFCKVNINYNSKQPPFIERVTDKWRQEVKPEKLGKFDEAMFENVDLVVTLYEYKGAHSLWLQEGHFKLMQDPITSKYENIPVLGGNDDEPMPF